METSKTIQGRVISKEDNYPIANVVINVILIDISLLRGDKLNWQNLLKKPEGVSLGSSDATDDLGTFSIEISREDKPITDLAVAIEVWPPEDEGSEREPKPLFRSQVPRRLGTQDFFLIRIPKERLIPYDLFSQPPSRGDRLKEFADERKELRSLHQAFRKQRIQEMEGYRQNAKKAFKKFTPSSLPESVRKQRNYVANRRTLNSALNGIRRKALEQIQGDKTRKKHTINLPKHVKEELNQKSGKPVTLPFYEAKKFINYPRSFGEKDLEKKLNQIDQQVEAEQKIVDKLFKQIVNKDK